MSKVVKKSNFCLFFLLLMSVIDCSAVKKMVILKEPFDIRFHDQFNGGVIVQGETVVSVYRDDSDRYITRIEKEKTSFFTMKTRHGNIKVSVTHTVSLNQGGALKSVLTIKPERTIYDSPEASRIIEEGYLKVWKHILGSKVLIVTLTANPIIFQRSLSIQVNGGEPETERSYFTNAEELTKFQHAMLIIGFINSIRAENPPEILFGVNFIVGLGKLLKYQRDINRRKTSAVCSQHLNCRLQATVYKENIQRGVTTGFRFCFQHRHYSLGYLPVVMHLFRSAVESDLIVADLRNPESVFILVSANTPMIEEISQSRAFLFLREVLARPGVTGFLRENGFWVPDPSGSVVTASEPQRRGRKENKATMISFDTYQDFLPDSQASAGPGWPPFFTGCTGTGNGQVNPKQDEGWPDFGAESGKNSSQDEKRYEF